MLRSGHLGFDIHPDPLSRWFGICGSCPCHSPVTQLHPPVLSTVISRAPLRHAADLIHFVAAEFVQGRLEVIENDGVGKTLEDKGELPEWVDALGRSQREALGHGGDVDNDEDDGEAHTDEHDCEARRYPGKLDESELVAVSDVPHEVDSCKDPPRIAAADVSSQSTGGCGRQGDSPEQGLVRPGMDE